MFTRLKFSFSAKHAESKSVTISWLAQNQDNVSEWSDMSTHRLVNVSEWSDMSTH
jgi:hypothetical protein